MPVFSRIDLHVYPLTDPKNEIDYILGILGMPWDGVNLPAGFRFDGHGLIVPDRFRWALAEEGITFVRLIWRADGKLDCVEFWNRNGGMR